MQTPGKIGRPKVRCFVGVLPKEQRKQVCVLSLREGASLLEGMYCLPYMKALCHQLGEREWWHLL